jgi:hypothetical protein
MQSSAPMSAKEALDRVLKMIQTAFVQRRSIPESNGHDLYARGTTKRPSGILRESVPSYELIQSYVQRYAFITGATNFDSTDFWKAVCDGVWAPKCAMASRSRPSAEGNAARAGRRLDPNNKEVMCQINTESGPCYQHSTMDVTHQNNSTEKASPATVLAYVPPRARGSKLPAKRQTLTERCGRRRDGLTDFRREMINGRTKQEFHLFESILGSLKNNDGGPPQFASAIMANYVDQITSFSHVHFHRTHLNSYLGLCAWWMQCAVDEIDPNPLMPASFAADPVVRKAFAHVFGPSAVYEPVHVAIPDTVSRNTHEEFHSAFTMLIRQLRGDAADLKHNASMPTKVPVSWERSLETGTMQSDLVITASDEDTQHQYSQRLTLLQLRFAALPVEVESHGIIIRRLEQKATLQYGKLTTARTLLQSPCDTVEAQSHTP